MATELRHIPIAELDRSDNVRRTLGDLDDLAASIADIGILQPVTVAANGDGWHLVAGHRRTAAAEMAGLDQVPALVLDATDAPERRLAMIVENLQRLDLDPVEEAVGYRRLVDAGWSQAEVARRVRRSRGHVSRRLRLLALPDEVQAMVSDGDVTVEHAYTLSRLADKKPAEAEQLVAYASERPEQAERRLAQVEASERRDRRQAKLERAGVTVVLADRPWHNEHTELAFMQLAAGDHADEPCHAILLAYDDYLLSNVVEKAMCTDRDRHGEDGESELKRPTPIDRQREWQAEEAARRAEDEARYRDLTDRLLAADDHLVIAAALRISAAEYLQLPPYADDRLLPVPEGMVDEQADWMLPMPVIDGASAGDVARALARRWLTEAGAGWITHRPRRAAAIEALAAALPDAPESG